MCPISIKGSALKTPWPHKQDEQLPEAFLQRLQQLLKRPDNKEKLLERLDPAILDVINNPKKIQKTTAIGTLF
jgi:hypothetical protein